MIPILTHIFEMGFTKHQPVIIWNPGVSQGGGVGVGWLNRTLLSHAGFNARDLTPGWHHIAVVASGRCTTCPVFGKSRGIRGEDEMGFMKMPWAYVCNVYRSI